LKRQKSLDPPSFVDLARGMQSIGRGRHVAAAMKGRPKMLSIANVHQIAISILGALLASSLFVSAAIGPAVPLV
jgi:hypothetical protein